MSTQTGLYRYFMNDIVRVTGKFHETPTIQFVQKGKGVTNITGEKLYESQVIQAVLSAEDYRFFDYVVINDDVDRTVAEVESIVRAERCRTGNSSRLVKTILATFPLGVKGAKEI